MLCININISAFVGFVFDTRVCKLLKIDIGLRFDKVLEFNGYREDVNLRKKRRGKLRNTREQQTSLEKELS